MTSPVGNSIIPNQNSGLVPVDYESGWLSNFYQEYDEGLRLFTSYKRTDCLDSLCDSFRTVSIVFLANRQNNYLDRNLFASLCSKISQQLTLGATSSSSRLCSLQRTLSVVSPEMPKLTECIRQKLESQMRELTRFWIKESPIQMTSGSPSLASVMNLWCWNWYENKFIRDADKENAVAYSKKYYFGLEYELSTATWYSL